MDTGVHMATANDIAVYLTYLAQSGEEPDPLSHLRLQKLLYYVQGWSLAHRNKTMFAERIEAWAHGPVVPEIYREYSAFGRDPFTIEGEPSDFNLSEEEREFASEIWEAYKPFSASKLREMTHLEAPWVDARKGYAPMDRCNVEITPAALLEYFSKLAKE